MSVAFSEWLCDNAEQVCDAWNEQLPENEWVDCVYEIKDDDFLCIQYQEHNEAE